MHHTTKITPNDAIAQMTAYGPIVLIDDQSGIAITINGAYLNAWSVYNDHDPVNFACRAMPEDLYKTTGATMIDLAREYLNDILLGDVDSDE